jgi:hypothetical protein
MFGSRRGRSDEADTDTAEAPVAVFRHRNAADA